MWQEINYFLWGGSAGIEKKEAIAEIITAHGGLLGGGFHLWILATTDPLRGSQLWLRLSSSCALASPRLHGVFHNTPSPPALWWL